jgi:hypothetical protein
MRGRVLASVAISVVAVAVVAIAWLQDVPDISGDDAVAAAERALADAGLDADVDPEPQRSVYTTASRDQIDVWAVRATVRSEPIELQLAVAGAHPITIDDRTTDGAAYVLSELEYKAVAANVDDPALARTLRRNISLTVAAALVIALAIAHAAIAARTKEDPG